MNENGSTIIDNLKKESSAFRTLFDEGNLDTMSVKEAEEKLCKEIAAKTDDPDLIEAIFKESALYRPNAWNKGDYGKNLIQSAIASVSKTADIPNFIVSHGEDYAVDCYLLAKWMFQKYSIKLAVTEGERCPTIYIYKDGYYRICGESELQGMIKNEINDVMPDLVRLATLRTTYGLIVNDISNVVNLLEMNSDENIINFQNGILHLDAMKLTSHSPKYLSTIQIPCNWTDTPSDTPIFDGFISTLANGDPELIRYLITIIGITISNIYGHNFKKAFFLYGSGNTGKTQFKRLLEKLVGEKNCVAIGLSSLEERFGVSTIFQKRLAGTADLGSISVKELAKFKQVTGGDELFADVKFKSPLSFVYRGILLNCCNHLPKFSGDKGEWMYDRFAIIPCNNVVPESKRDSKLLDKMYSERQGIVCKAIKTLKQYVLASDKYNLEEPKVVVDARENYKAENSVVAKFFNECMVSSSGLSNCRVSSISVVLKVFFKWCKDNNNGYCIDTAQFKKELAEHIGVPVEKLIVHTSTGNVISGYTLTDDAQTLYR